MSVLSAWRTAILAILVFVGVTGCDYLERNSKVSEETEAHFIDGVTSKKLQDFDGAISKILVFNRTLTSAERVAVEAAVAP